jgi:DNA repair protein RecN (Recombination protein N)
LNNLESLVALDPETLQILQERLDLGYRLLKKHQVQATGELIQLAAELGTELNTHSDAEAEIGKLKEAFRESEAALTSLAAQLHAARTASAPAFAKQINGLLKLIGMPDARLKIECREKETFDEFGKEDISFLWDANKSGDFQPFQKTASGGELSRIMLCIKTLTAKALALPTLIFDEVDTGISGEAAKQVALLLRSLSESHQVMSITHQAQIAAKGTAHFYVYKTKNNQQINTRIRQLEEKERVRILAQMIGGDNPSPAALKNAEELMGVA